MILLLNKGCIFSILGRIRLPRNGSEDHTPWKNVPYLNVFVVVDYGEETFEYPGDDGLPVGVQEIVALDKYPDKDQDPVK